jgi:hypothetical protein
MSKLHTAVNNAMPRRYDAVVAKRAAPTPMEEEFDSARMSKRRLLPFFFCDDPSGCILGDKPRVGRKGLDLSPQHGLWRLRVAKDGELETRRARVENQDGVNHFVANVT